MKDNPTKKEKQLMENIDQQSISTILKAINIANKSVPFAIESNIHLLSLFVDEVVNSLKQNGRLIYVGVGISARIAIVDAVECIPTYGMEPNRIIVIMPGGEKTFLTSFEKENGNLEIGMKYMEKTKIRNNDIVLGISINGKTPFVLGALKFAKEKGAIIGALSNSKNAIINKYAKYCFFIDTGPEIIASSTWMKATTSQKLILNMITTAAMIKLGKVYGNLMVDVLPNNEKLIERAISLIMRIAKVDRRIAKKAFKDSKMNAKIAVVMILKKVNECKAKKILNDNEGFLHRIIK